jgi:hypothetical protein
MRSNELPDAALHLIQGLALGRHVGGTNKYAAVCRSWRKASQLRDYEPLRLLVDLHGASYDQLDTATAWFARYGSQVQHLVHSTYVSPSWPVLQQLWVSPTLPNRASRAGHGWGTSGHERGMQATSRGRAGPLVARPSCLLVPGSS